MFSIVILNKNKYVLMAKQYLVGFQLVKRHACRTINKEDAKYCTLLTVFNNVSCQQVLLQLPVSL